ncbi:hypothetical protein N7G274_004454 [Stereocaulon virgatum]|uniref:Uncharacterized protein n=1 Tax=Stereocaulon virgatum TaxID=373712 RepID=A0ABR4AAA5_9LECA
MTLPIRNRASTKSVSTKVMRKAMVVRYPKPRGRISAGTSGTETVMDNDPRLRRRIHCLQYPEFGKRKIAEECIPLPTFAYIQRTSHATADIGEARGSIWHERGHPTSYNPSPVSSKGPQPSTITTNAPIAAPLHRLSLYRRQEIPSCMHHRTIAHVPSLGFVHHHEPIADGLHPGWQFARTYFTPLASAFMIYNGRIIGHHYISNGGPKAASSRRLSCDEPFM